MAFLLERTESIPEGMRRIATEQLDLAISELESQQGDADEHVHEARKALKRLRAVLWLVRAVVGDGIFRLENGCCRDAARRLSGTRDATALLEALEALVAYAGRRVRRGRFATVSRWLEERRDGLGTDAALVAGERQRALDDLRWARRRAEEWPLAQCTWDAVEAGVRQVYARGRGGYERALSEDDEAVFHEWRKWAKYLWYQTQVLAGIWPAMMSALAAQLDELGDTLGQEHDLSVLRHAVQTELSRPIRATTLQALLELTAERQANLRLQARHLGRRLYVERPRDFAARLRGYWRAWHGDAAPAPAPASPRARRAAAAHSAPELVADCACETGEGPLWHPLENRLYWIDIPRGLLCRYEPASDRHEQCLQLDRPIGGFAIQADGSLLLFLARGGVAAWRDGRLDHLVEELEAERETRFNDVIADPTGRVFCGTMPAPGRAARLYRMDPDRTLTVVLDDVGVANGMGFSPDRRTFYFTDSGRSVIERFDYDERTGAITGRRAFVGGAAHPGVPDGMTVDEEGCVWSARWGGACVIRYSPAGEELQRIELPTSKVSSVTFGGDDYRDLYLTTAGGQEQGAKETGAGGLFRVRVAVRGVPEFLSRIAP